MTTPEGLAGGETFDEYADEYDATVQAAIGASGESVAWFAELKAKLAQRFAPANVRHVVDFGCGVGNVSRALAPLFAEAVVTGTDPSAESLAVARKRSGSGLHFVQSTEGLPLGDASADLAIAACVFHHIPPRERRHWVDEVRRVLRPGGRFMIFEHNPYNPLTRRVVANVPFDEGAELLTRRDTERLVRAAGLRIDRSAYYFFFPRLLAALRPLERYMGWVPLGGQYFVIGER